MHDCVVRDLPATLDNYMLSFACMYMYTYHVIQSRLE